jgi:hypothetical protein
VAVGRERTAFRKLSDRGFQRRHVRRPGAGEKLAIGRNNASAVSSDVVAKSRPAARMRAVRSAGVDSFTRSLRARHSSTRTTSFFSSCRRGRRGFRPRAR